MSTIVVCVPWLVLDRDLMHIQLRNSGSRISGRDSTLGSGALDRLQGGDGLNIGGIGGVLLDRNWRHAQERASVHGTVV